MTTLPMQLESERFACPSRARQGRGSPPATGVEDRLLAGKPWGICLAIHAGLILIASLGIAILAGEPKPLSRGSTDTPPIPPEASSPAVATAVSIQGDDSNHPTPPGRQTPTAHAGLGDGESIDSQDAQSAASPTHTPIPDLSQFVSKKASQAYGPASNPARSDDEPAQGGNHDASDKPSTRPKQVADAAAVPDFTKGPPTGARGPFGLDMSLPDGSVPQRIVYVIDASGSLVDTFPLVRQAIARGVMNLGHDQKFTVLFFQADDVLEPAPFGLQRATTERKVTVDRWMDQVRPRGHTQPIPAIKRALGYRPDAVVLISDNITGLTMPDLNQQVLDQAIGQFNQNAAVIHTVEFLRPDPLRTVPGKTPTLKHIANQTSGHYQFVSLEDVGLSSDVSSQK